MGSPSQALLWMRYTMRRQIVLTWRLFLSLTYRYSSVVLVDDGRQSSLTFPAPVLHSCSPPFRPEYSERKQILHEDAPRGRLEPAAVHRWAGADGDSGAPGPKAQGGRGRDEEARKVFARQYVV